MTGKPLTTSWEVGALSTTVSKIHTNYTPRKAYADDIKDPTIKPNNTASASEGSSFPSIQKQRWVWSSLAINSLLDFKSSALKLSHISALNAAISGPENRAVPCPYSVVIDFL